MAAFQVRDLRRDPEHGFWLARLVMDGESLETSREFGTWQTIGEGHTRRQRRHARRQFISPEATKVLQAHVIPIENRERREREAEEEARQDAEGTIGTPKAA